MLVQRHTPLMGSILVFGKSLMKFLARTFNRETFMPVMFGWPPLNFSRSAHANSYIMAGLHCVLKLMFLLQRDDGPIDG